MNTQARVLITKLCHRNCPNCCSKYTSIVKDAIESNNTKDFKKYDVVMITGGEPMLFPDKVITFTRALKKQNPNVKVFLYTALYTKRLREVMEVVDGVHFTIHAEATKQDIEDFQLFQGIANTFKLGGYTKSFRLYCDPNCLIPFTLYPWLWKRMEIKPWIMEGDCKLPDNEDLYVLNDNFV